MRYNYAVFGAGRQGTAAAYDLAVHGKAKRIILFDIDENSLNRSVKKLKRIIPKKVKIEGLVNKSYMVDSLNTIDFDAAVSALPYFLGTEIAGASIRASVPVCDLGCDTDVVYRQLALDSLAKKSKVAIVPDCGLAPGSSTMFSMYVYDKIKKLKHKPRSIRTYCGGLPSKYSHSDPLNYKIVFSPLGLINNYAARSWVLENNIVKQVESLDVLGLEKIDHYKLGELEAFHTSGGASLLPWKFKDKGLNNFFYKTIRYPGHLEQMITLKQLGLIDLKGNNSDIVKDVWTKIISKKLERKNVPDLVILFSECLSDNGTNVSINLIDYADNNFSAMERTTGFSAGLVAYMLAKGAIKPGVHTPDECIKPNDYIKGLKQRGFNILETINKPISF